MRVRYSEETPIQSIKRIISSVLGDPYSLVLFGSRALGTDTIGSDYDIAIQSSSQLTHGILRALRAALRETPYEVDIVDLNDPHLKQSFLEEVKRTGIEV